MNRKLYWSLFFWMCFQVNAASLCKENEKVSFSCGVGSKSVSVCSDDDKTVIYRFGQPQAIELELRSEVNFSSTPYSGGGEGNLSFSRGAYQYIVYSSISNGDWLENGEREKIERAGIYVVKDQVLIIDIPCKHYSGKRFIDYLPPHQLQSFTSYY